MKRAALGLVALSGCFIGAEDVPPPIDAPGPQGRYEAAVAFDTARGRMVMYGGVNEVGVQTATWVFADGRWSQLLGPGPGAREGAAMAYDVARDRVVLFGGDVLDPSAPCDATWELAGDQWSRVDAPGPSCRRGHAMTYDGEARRVVLFGGFAEQGCDEGACQETWAYDGAWTRLHRPP